MSVCVCVCALSVYALGSICGCFCSRPCKERTEIFFCKTHFEQIHATVFCKKVWMRKTVKVMMGIRKEAKTLPWKEK